MLDRAPGVDPWAVPTELNNILEDVYAFLGRFVAYPSAHAQVAYTDHRSSRAGLPGTPVDSRASGDTSLAL